jgi:hypothetical protein
MSCNFPSFPTCYISELGYHTQNDKVNLKWTIPPVMEKFPYFVISVGEASSEGAKASVRTKAAWR